MVKLPATSTVRRSLAISVRLLAHTELLEIRFLASGATTLHGGRREKDAAVHRPTANDSDPPSLPPTASGPTIHQGILPQVHFPSG
jgi:hypothetical protein